MTRILPVLSALVIFSVLAVTGCGAGVSGSARAAAPGASGQISSPPSLSGAADGSRDGTADSSGPLTVKASTVRSLQVVTGKPEWAEQAKGYMRTISMTFRPDGSMVMTADMRADLVPLVGSYQLSGSNLQFQGHSETQNPGGSAMLDISGSVDLATKVMTIDWSSTSGLAAVIYGQPTSSTTTAVYKAEVDVVVG